MLQAQYVCGPSFPVQIPSKNFTEWAGGITDYSKGPFDMLIKEIKVIDYSSGTAYRYSDQSGSWESIQSIGGKIGAGPQTGAGNDVSAVPDTGSITTRNSKTGFLIPPTSKASKLITSKPTPIPSTHISKQSADSSESTRLSTSSQSSAPSSTSRRRTWTSLSFSTSLSFRHSKSSSPQHSTSLSHSTSSSRYTKSSSSSHYTKSSSSLHRLLPTSFHTSKPHGALTTSTTRSAAPVTTTPTGTAFPSLRGSGTSTAAGSASSRPSASRSFSALPSVLPTGAAARIDVAFGAAVGAAAGLVLGWAF
jgi:hypothetical protein